MTTSGEVLYTFGTPYPDVLVRGRACKVKMPVYRDGASVVPTITGSSFSLYAPDGTAIVDSQAITVVASVARLTIAAVDLPATLGLGEGYQERWTLVLADRTETVDREAALCVRPLYPVVSDNTLTARYSNLNRYLPQGVTSWQTKIDAAWDEIVRRLAREGHLSYGVKSPDQLQEPHRLLTMHYIFDDFAMTQRDAAAWRERAKEQRELYEAAWSPASWRYDDDLDGRVDDVSQRRGAGMVIQSGGSPPYTALTARSLGV